MSAKPMSTKRSGSAGGPGAAGQMWMSPKRAPSSDVNTGAALATQPALASASAVPSWPVTMPLTRTRRLPSGRVPSMSEPEMTASVRAPAMIVLEAMSTRAAVVPMPAALGVAAKRSRRLISALTTPEVRRAAPIISVATMRRRVRSLP